VHIFGDAKIFAKICPLFTNGVQTVNILVL